jgi:hypothetical protein
MMLNLKTFESAKHLHTSLADHEFHKLANTAGAVTMLKTTNHISTLMALLGVSMVFASPAAAEKLTLIGGNLNFKEVTVGGHKSETLIFENMYSVKYEPPATLTKTMGATLAFANKGETDCSGDVPSGSQCLIVIEFSPTVAELYKAKLKISYENPCSNMKENSEFEVEGKGK